MTDLSSDLHWAPGWQIREAIMTRRVSATEVATRFIERIEALDRGLHAFFTLSADVALGQARAIDRRIDRGEPVGALAGVPVSIKDQFWTKGIRTTSGSHIYADHVPEEDSLHVARVKAADGLIIGKTATPEFGTFWRTAGRVAPECVNPWDSRRTSGGSSGGAAASVAAGFGPLALGSDSGGSIRLPSAMCGVLGVLPSNGRVPNHGSFGSTLFLSRVGPISRDVRDAGTLLQLLARPSVDDPLCRLDEPPDYLSGLDDGIAGLRLGWWEDQSISGQVDAAVITAIKKAACGLSSLGANFVDDAVTFDTQGVDEAWRVLDFVDRYAELGESLYTDPLARRKLTPYARERFAWAKRVSGAEYSRAVRRRAEFIRSFEAAFRSCDLVLSPTLGFTAPVIESVGPTQRIPTLVAYTLAVNLAGFAAASIPCGFVGGMPIGLQVIAPPNQEALVLRAARAFEQAWPWVERKPAI
ncbi:amidase [Bradyrhizobium jicamae]|uniref:Indoleacetamide hydrolase n=1 Tax=Bradyrhizobium jicamae TaxID=280332 RepID=A0ABS5FVJ1_9BRAD|nr:amidase [Bradyrhizobium jicamae]MBR0800753.1 amidase [Bradyrhizobium jicamae]